MNTEIADLCVVGNKNNINVNNIPFKCRINYIKYLGVKILTSLDLWRELKHLLLHL